MNYIREAENILRYYKDIYRSIDNMQFEISRLIGRQAPSSLTAVSMDITGIRASRHDEAINVMYKIQTLTASRQRSIDEFARVEAILDEISKEPGCELYGKVLRLWYIEKMPKEKIAEQLHYEHRQRVYELRPKAIRKFAATYFGVDAIKAM